MRHVIKSGVEERETKCRFVSVNLNQDLWFVWEENWIQMT